MTTKEEIDEITTINFSITKCPLKVFKKFVEYCKHETNDNYSFGLKLLLDAMEGNIKEAVLYEQYMEMKQELAQVKLMVANKPVEEKKKIKTFGGGDLNGE